MTDSECSAVADLPGLMASEGDRRDDARRLRGLVDAHYDFVWRALRYLGLGDDDAQDAAQQVMCVLARRIAEVTPGVERAFLFSTASLVAGTWRRTARRRPETATNDLR